MSKIQRMSFTHSHFELFWSYYRGFWQNPDTVQRNPNYNLVFTSGFILKKMVFLFCSGYCSLCCLLIVL